MSLTRGPSAVAEFVVVDGEYRQFKVRYTGSSVTFTGSFPYWTFPVTGCYRTFTILDVSPDWH